MSDKAALPAHPSVLSFEALGRRDSDIEFVGLADSLVVKIHDRDVELEARAPLSPSAESTLLAWLLDRQKSRERDR